MSSELVQRPCKKCGAPLIFVTGPNGSAIPLDERAPVYAISEDMLKNPVAEKLTGAYVSHVATCPAANDLSKKGARR